MDAIPFGTVFRITPKGKLTTLYNFCGDTNCSDGNEVLAGLVQGTDGNFYGTTYSGGIGWHLRLWHGFQNHSNRSADHALQLLPRRVSIRASTARTLGLGSCKAPTGPSMGRQRVMAPTARAQSSACLSALARLLKRFRHPAKQEPA